MFTRTKNIARNALLGTAAAVAATLALAAPSEARDFGGGHFGGGYHHCCGVSIGFGFGAPYYWGPYYSSWYPYYGPYPYSPAYYSTYAAPYPYRPSTFVSAPVVFDLFPPTVVNYADNQVRDAYYNAYNQALTAPVGAAIAWNDGGEVHGDVTTTRDGWAGQKYCREFRQSIVIGGRAEQAYGTACQLPDGAWQLVPNQR